MIEALWRGIRAVSHPRTIWKLDDNRDIDVRYFYLRYVPVVASFSIAAHLIRELDPGTGILGAFISVLISLLALSFGLYINTLIVEIALSWAGQPTGSDDSTRITAYSSTPVYLIGVLDPFLPKLWWYYTVPAWLYGFYMLWQGVAAVYRLPTAAKIKFVLSCAIAWPFIQFLVLLFEAFLSILALTLVGDILRLLGF